MAISIDSVYKEILNIIKDEDLERAEKAFEGSSLSSRGRKSYMTPAEFNVLAERAQHDVFEKTLEEYKLTYKNNKNYEDNSELDLIKSKINPFRVVDAELNKASGYPNDPVTHPIDSIYYIEYIYNIGANTAIQFEEVSQSYFSKIKAFSTSKAFLKKDLYHVYYKENDSAKVYLYPEPTNNPKINYIKKPTTPKWDSSVDLNTGIVSQSLSGSVDFELHESQRSSLVNKILFLAGMSTDDTQVSNMALRDEAENQSVKNS